MAPASRPGWMLLEWRRIGPETRGSRLRRCRRTRAAWPSWVTLAGKLRRMISRRGSSCGSRRTHGTKFATSCTRTTPTSTTYFPRSRCFSTTTLASYTITPRGHPAATPRPAPASSFCSRGPPKRASCCTAAATTLATSTPSSPSRALARAPPGRDGSPPSPLTGPRPPLWSTLVGLGANAASASTSSSRTRANGSQTPSWHPRQRSGTPSAAGASFSARAARCKTRTRAR
mmetsp:Transcript_6616/g.16044  ORF Transcript_6616/g.16044 Transcript_6616/m.16044 type:complete len:231 (-) Transcript_6616:333-1025(-)